MKSLRFTHFTQIFLLALFVIPASSAPKRSEQHFLYVASPGVRNYTEYGGVGVLVFDIDQGYKFVRRIPTWNVSEGEKPEKIKGIAASAKPARIFVTPL